MRKFVVNVNGKAYEVEVEEIGGAAAAMPAAPVAPAAAPAPAAPAPAAAAPAPAAAPAAPKASAASVAGEPVLAPMPGTIVKVLVKVGQSVKSGDVLCILEAMKMENEIMAGKDGTITAVEVNDGTSVSSGDVLVAIG
jgi:glutaconyl-CoA decarboxylase